MLQKFLVIDRSYSEQPFYKIVKPCCSEPRFKIYSGQSMVSYFMIFFAVQNTTVARARTLATSSELMIGAGAKFEIVMLLAVARAKTWM